MKYLISSLVLLSLFAPFAQATTVSGEVYSMGTQLSTANTLKKAYILRKIAEVKADIAKVEKLILAIEKKREAVKKSGGNTSIYDKKIEALKSGKEALKKALALLEKQLVSLK